MQAGAPFGPGGRRRAPETGSEVDGTAAAAQRKPTIGIVRMLAVAAVVLTCYVLAAWLGLAPLQGLPGAAAYPTLLATAVPVFAALVLGYGLRRGRARAAGQDPLAGLYSGPQADQVLPILMARDDRSGCSQLALVRVGVDRLDDLRRRYGDEAAARVLASLGRHIRSQTRGEDLPMRPDEHGFAVFLRCAEVEQAAAFCRRLATLARSDQLDWQGDVIKVALSMGVALREPGEPLDGLQARALEQLGRARAEGSVQVAA